jgi:predicted Zn-dependent protease
LPLAWTQPALAKTYTPQQEAKAGEEAAKEIVAKTPEWTNDEQRARCQTIVDAIALHTERPEVKYTVRLLDTDDVNAFSLPGGTVFVTRGLLQPSANPDLSQLVIQSDHELAGVLAHEIAHNCHYDGLRNAERSADLLKGGIAAALLTLLAGGGALGAWEVMNVGLSFGQGILSQYSIEYESGADRDAVGYLAQTTYNPNGLLTFIERLAAQERSRLQQDLGVLQTHPYSPERVQGLRQAMTAHGIEVNRRAVTNWTRAEPLDAIVHGKPAAVVMLWDQTVYTFSATAPTGETPAQRAQAAAQSLNDALSKGMAQNDIRVVENQSDPYVTVMGERLLTVLAGDVESGATARQTADAAASRLRAAMFGDALGRTFRTGG